MKKTLIFAFAMLAVPALASAQGGGQRGGGPGMMQSNVAKLLIEKKADVGLSEDQVAKLDVIAKALDAKNAPLLEEARKAREAGGDRQAMMATMQKVRANGTDAFDQEIKPLLSAEQVTKAEKVIADAQPQRRGGGR